MLAEWGNYNAKLKGILQGIYEDGAGPDERSAAEGAMKTAIENNYILTSDAIQFTLNELAKAGSGTWFREIIEMARGHRHRPVGAGEYIGDCQGQRIKSRPSGPELD